MTPHQMRPLMGTEGALRPRRILTPFKSGIQTRLHRKAAYDGTVATYRQTVLTAFQEVEDQLAAQSLLTKQLAEETAALSAAQRTLEISNNRYKPGVEQYLDVIVAQSVQLLHKQNVVQLNGKKLAASVSLIKAMGSGWHSNPSRRRAGPQG